MENASITVEASFVMIIVLTVIGTCIMTGFSLHDKVLSRAVLIESVELSSHRRTDGPPAERYSVNEEKLQNVLSGRVPEMTFEENIAGTVTAGEVTGENFCYRMENHHIRVEELLRTLTLTELFSGEENETDD